MKEQIEQHIKYLSEFFEKEVQFSNFMRDNDIDLSTILERTTYYCAGESLANNIVSMREILTHWVNQINKKEN